MDFKENIELPKQKKIETKENSITNPIKRRFSLRLLNNNLSSKDVNYLPRECLQVLD